MYVARGPVLLRVSGVEQALAAGSHAAPTAGNVATFRFRRSCVVTGLMLGTDTGADADLAGFELSIEDHRGEQLVTDGRRALFVSARALVGKSRRVFPLEVPVTSGNLWTIAIQNVGPNLITPRLFFRIADA